MDTQGQGVDNKQTTTTTTIKQIPVVTLQFITPQPLSLQALIYLNINKERTAQHRKAHMITPFPLWYNNNTTYQQTFITFDRIATLYRNGGGLERVIQSLSFAAGEYTALTRLSVAPVDRVDNVSTLPPGTPQQPRGTPRDFPHTDDSADTQLPPIVTS